MNRFLVWASQYTGPGAGYWRLLLFYTMRAYLALKRSRVRFQLRRIAREGETKHGFFAHSNVPRDTEEWYWAELDECWPKEKL